MLCQLLDNVYMQYLTNLQESRGRFYKIMGSVPMIIHAPIVTLLNELIEIIMPFNPIHTSECFAYLRIIFSCKDTNIFSFSQIFSEEIDQENRPRDLCL